LAAWESADALWEKLISGISVNAIEKINTQETYLQEAANLAERKKARTCLKLTFPLLLFDVT